MNCPEKTLAELLNVSPLLNITNVPNNKKPMPKTMVLKQPTLKSNKADFVLYCFVSLFFSIAQSDCHTAMSNGAGIQPIKAIKKAISKLFSGSICLNEIGSTLFTKAMLTAIMVLMESVIMIIFIKRSKSLYFPKINSAKQIMMMITVHNFTLIKSPNSEDAKPAVTIVTAV